ncbi:2'-5' RNA ligase family protein, partial [Francisella tularensis subsp. holarctica]|nr:2'-5' RNA ligase family protein [Francisella tularensis subsp. holarctica]
MLNKHKLFYKLFILYAYLFITLDSFAESIKQYNFYLIPD